MKDGIGEAVRRKEDQRLIRGQGTYSDDFNEPGQVFAIMVRSPHPHAWLRGFDKTDALAVPGVLGIYTGQYCLEDGLKPIPHMMQPSAGMDIGVSNRDGTVAFQGPHFILPHDKARYAGEAIAMVVAQSVAAARDGAELLVIDYDPLPAVTNTVAACAPDAPRLYDDIPTNVTIDADVGNEAAADAAFNAATHIVKLETWAQRVTGVPMEPRAALGVYDETDGRYTVYAGVGGVVRAKMELAGVLGVEPEKVRWVAKEIGGNFGTRNSFFPEFALVAWASKKLGKPVKWTAERTESFLSDFQGRDLHVTAELALAEDGKFLAMRGSNISNIGAYGCSVVPLIKGVEIMSGIYDIPAAYFRARAVYSNTPSTAPYRSAGRPEVVFVTERLVDLACIEHGFDPIEIRRRNIIPKENFPYDNPLGFQYDSGAYEDALDMVLALGDWDDYEARKLASEKNGKLRGRGLAAYVETSTGAPRERAEVTVRPEGKVDCVIGTLSSGQGHETSFPQLLTEWLNVPHEDINMITGDTDIVSVGGGSHSGRSMRLAGITIGLARDQIIEKGTRIAGYVLEAAESDIEFTDGDFIVSGTDRRLSLFDAAAAARDRDDLPEDLQGPLDGVGDFIQKKPAFPFGAHICEVELDETTGAYQIVRYAGVDDVGRAINPLILHGQAHGGIAQGLGQALCESAHYDPETGQMLSASFLDYALPRADHFPSFDTKISEYPTPINPLGIRAGGTTPALAALVNAVVDAVRHRGVRHIEMPVTSERVWRAMNEE
ncbi:MAG: xanthine dehydrogenase family protein molybdopterin-binding subunit [Proteobacteria bacterium]|nr:xanthine dehydrogenase family protein molybdopterin-binding subunit [Pseudomonadota bacterium]